MIVTVEIQEPGSGPKSYQFGPGKYRVGKQSTADIEVKTTFASRLHAFLEVTPEDVIYKDNHSTNGTFFEGEQILGPILLQIDDTLVIGPAQIVILDIEPNNSLPPKPISEPIPPASEVEENPVVLEASTLPIYSFDEAPAAPPVELAEEGVNLVAPEKALWPEGLDDLVSSSPRVSKEQNTEVSAYVKPMDFADLNPFMLDDQVTSVMIQGTQGFFVQREGQISQVHSLSTDGVLKPLIEYFLSLSSGETPSSGVASGYLDNGAFYQVILPPVVKSLDEPLITIEKLPRVFPTAEKTIEVGACDQAILNFLLESAQQKKNILVCGSNKVEKNRWLRLLAEALPSGNRVMVLNNTPFQTLKHPNWMMLEANEYTQDQQVVMLEAASRLYPDTVLIDAMQNDLLSSVLCHAGQYFADVQLMSSTTAHSPEDWILQWRLQAQRFHPQLSMALFEACIVAHYDVMVFLEPLPNSIWERVSAVYELSLQENKVGSAFGHLHLQPVFKFSAEHHSFLNCQEVPAFIGQLGLQVEPTKNNKSDVKKKEIQQRGLHIGLGESLS